MISSAELETFFHTFVSLNTDNGKALFTGFDTVHIIDTKCSRPRLSFY